MIAYAVWLALVRRPPARTRRRPLACFYLGVVDVGKYLRQIPHLEIRPTDRAIAVMVGFRFGDAVEVLGGGARERLDYGHIEPCGAVYNPSSLPAISIRLLLICC